jgi:hypothetical protein
MVNACRQMDGVPLLRDNLACDQACPASLARYVEMRSSDGAEWTQFYCCPQWTKWPAPLRESWALRSGELHRRPRPDENLEVRVTVASRRGGNAAPRRVSRGSAR